MIRCGNCKQKHVNVQDVKDCYAGRGPSVQYAENLERQDRPEPSLWDRPQQQTPMPTVPAGRYAVEMDDTLKFYKVDCPTEGRWAGYTFIKVYASDETWPIKDRDHRVRILSKIQEDGPHEAMLRYGREIGKCGHCGRTLTDEDSRARGIGPVCAGKLG